MDSYGGAGRTCRTQQKKVRDGDAERGMTNCTYTLLGVLHVAPIIYSTRKV